MNLAQLFLTVCDPMDYTIHVNLQARILEWIAFPSSRGSSQPRDQTQVSHITGRFFTSWATREAQEHWNALAYPFSRRSSQPRNRTRVSCIAGGFFTNRAIREALYTLRWSEVAQSCPTLWDPMDCSLQGSSVHGIFQARVPEWVALSFYTLVICKNHKLSLTSHSIFPLV